MINWRQFITNDTTHNFELGLIWSKGNSLQQIANDIIQIISNDNYDYLACIETKGIIIASAVSALSGKELRIFRKKNKIIYTHEIYKRNFINWKNIEDGLEIEKNQILKNDRIIIIDDIIDRGITIQNVESIIKEANASIIKYVCIKNLSSLSNLNNVEIVSLL